MSSPGAVAPRSEADKYETVIGLEVHAQLLTKSKMFCSCSATYASAEPNTHVCPVCMGMPGMLPVINSQAVEYTIMTALALNCTIPEHTKFDRKNYPYPDLVKGYQISQYDAPIGRDGWMDIHVDGQIRRIRINRVHLEEDTARLLHRTDAWGEGYSLVDVNRSGVPLMEIVSEPDFRSPAEASSYLVSLRNILRYIGVSTGNMEEGSFRCDANISVRPRGSSRFEGKVEVKNMNSFRAVQRALEFEERRQRELVEAGERVVQETRGWVEERGETVSQRTKEYAHDYRYFPEPDLPPLVHSRELVEAIRQRLPELPEARRRRFVEELGLPEFDAGLLTADKATADYFEEALSAEAVFSEESRRAAESALPSDPELALRRQRAKAISNWMIGELTRLLHSSETDVAEIEQARVRPGQLAEMLNLMEQGILSGTAAKEVFEEMFRGGKSAAEIVEGKALASISDEDALAEVVRGVLAANPQAVADYLGGKQQALRFLTGQTMRQMRGRADAQVVTRLLEKALAEMNG